jgi:putative ribosome biogenesis GTPase RsgA
VDTSAGAPAPGVDSIGVASCSDPEADHSFHAAAATRDACFTRACNRCEGIEWLYLPANLE